MAGTLLAIDVGGTDIKAALFTEGGAELASASAPTPRGAADPGGAVLDAAQALAHSLEGPPPTAMGLVVPGIVDEAAGVGVFSTNLGWRSYPFRDRAQERFGIPVGFGHDVGMAGEAELAAGAWGAAGSGDAAVVVIGTGIAAALFDGGTRVRGSGFAGELGQLAVPHQGAWRPLEQVASAAAIGRAFAHRTGGPAVGSREVFEASGLHEAVGSAGPCARGAAVPPGGKLAAEARAVLDGAFDALAFAFLQVSALLGTGEFVLTGGLAKAGEPLRRPIQERLAEGVTFHRRATVSLGVLGARAGLMGALLCARRAGGGA